MMRAFAAANPGAPVSTPSWARRVNRSNRLAFSSWSSTSIAEGSPARLAAKAANATVPDTHDYSEAETRDLFIDLLLREAGWDLTAANVIEFPVTVRYHRNESYTKMGGIKDWWRLFRPALLLRTGVKR